MRERFAMRNQGCAKRAKQAKSKILRLLDLSRKAKSQA